MRLLNAYLREAKATKPYFILLPIIILLGYAFYHFAKPEDAIYFGREDHLVEWLTFFCLLAAGIYFFLSYRKFKNFYFLLLGIVMVFGSGEEISWGQRIIGYKTPDSIKQDNVQGEFTIHNLEVFNGKQFNKQKREGFARLLEMDLMFRIFMLCFGILLPLAVWHISPINKLVQKMCIPVPPVTIGAFFAAAWVGRKIVLFLLTEPPQGSNMRQYWDMRNAASEYYELMSAAVLLAIAVFFYKNRYGSLVGKDIKSYLINA